MDSSDADGLGYHDVDGDPHTAVLVANMNATAAWRATQRLLAWEREHLGLVDGERLLDVGCGRGEAAISLGFDLGTTGELVGVDASAAMLDVARRRSGVAPCAERFSVGDARSLDETDQSFDVVRSERTLQWLSEPASVVAEFVRVLRPGGRLSLTDTDWSTLHLDVGDPHITKMVRDGLRVERSRPSNVGRRRRRASDCLPWKLSRPVDPSCAGICPCSARCSPVRPVSPVRSTISQPASTTRSRLSIPHDGRRTAGIELARGHRRSDAARRRLDFYERHLDR